MISKIKYHTTYRICSVLALGLSLIWSGCDSGDDFQTSQSGLLSVTPESLTFPIIPSGQQVTQELELKNVGSAPIILINLRFNRDDAPYQLSLIGGEPLPDELSIEPEVETLTLAITYQPTELSVISDEDTLIIETNNASQRELVVPINASNAMPDLVVSPSSFDFGSVDAGEVIEREATLTNVGQGDLVITQMRIDGSPDFQIILEGEPLQENMSGEMNIAPSEQRVITLRYSPPTAGPDRGELVILSNSTTGGESRSALIANGAAPCIQVSPDVLDFGASLLVPDRDQATPNTLPLIVESCGGSPLKISRVEFEGTEFGFVTELTPMMGGELLQLPAAAADQAFPSEILEVGFWPLEERNYGGRLLLYTNTSIDPIVVDLFGRGVENSCPIPVTTTERYEVAPLDIITLDGSPSADPGGEVTRWVWSVIERPSGSVSQVVENLFSNPDPAGGGPEDDEATPTATFFVDLAGRYVIDLVVYDDLGQESCAPKASATVVIEAVPEKDLHIQLVWSTPEDPDETDESGTDVDLHFKHQNAGERWGSAADQWDCYFQQKFPDWGTIGDFLDNPSLDIDDTNGAGPENVNLNRPEVGVNYEVGALYYRADSQFGVAGRDPTIEYDSYVTVRLFARGELIGEYVDQLLNRTRQLWHVATINWCEDELACPVVTEVNRVYQDGEYAQ
jgi:hypothetical protein